jgi:hypothetical protein
MMKMLACHTSFGPTMMEALKNARVLRTEVQPF